MRILLVGLVGLLLVGCSNEGDVCDKIQPGNPFFNRFCGGVGDIHVAKTVPEPLQKLIRGEVDDVVDVLNIHFGTNFESPEVLFDAYGKSAGFVVPADNFSIVHLNPNRAHEEIMITMIVPHEVAHWMVHKAYDDPEPHGKEWIGMMKVLGVDPVRVLKLGGDK